jgi:ABC-type nickel/cobalt efflux system permease component RcnA
MNMANSLSLAAFSLGILHALEPGHGKMLMATTLVGTRRKWWDPLSIAISTAGGHALGLVAVVTASFFFAHDLASEEMRHTIELGAGVVITCVGVHLLIRAIRSLRKRARALPEDHIGSNSCRCSSCHDHHLSLVGFLLGIVPCPSALAVCLSSAGVSSYGEALNLSLLFAFGVAVTIAAIGVAIAHSSGRVMNKAAESRKIAAVLQLLSPSTIVILGLFMIIHAGANH